MRDIETMGCSRQNKVSFQWPAATFSERAPTTSGFLKKSKKSDWTRATNTTQTRTTLVPFRGCQWQLPWSLLERESTWSKDRGRLSYKVEAPVSLLSEPGPGPRLPEYCCTVGMRLFCVFPRELRLVREGQLPKPLLCY